MHHHHHQCLRAKQMKIFHDRTLDICWNKKWKKLMRLIVQFFLVDSVLHSLLCLAYWLDLCMSVSHIISHITNLTHKQNTRSGVFTFLVYLFLKLLNLKDYFLPSIAQWSDRHLMDTWHPTGLAGIEQRRLCLSGMLFDLCLAIAGPGRCDDSQHAESET